MSGKNNVKYRAFFENLNIAIQTPYEEYSGTSELVRQLETALDNWSITPLVELDGQTPAQYLSVVDDIGILMDMFRLGAVICDDDFPKVFKDRLAFFGETAVECLISLIHELTNVDGTEEEYLQPLMAVRLLGEWKTEKAVMPLIRLLKHTGPNREIFAEGIRDALVNIGRGAMDALITELAGHEGIRKAGADEGVQEMGTIKAADAVVFEYLLMAIADIGSSSRSDTVYRLLKESFYSMTDKALGAACLATYGDGRAVPVLRGYVHKNRQSLSKETFYDILSSIKKLGGAVDDL